ncbi:MAG: hypothetical protein H0T65_00945 [Deltaproteobacteria bacterium]|nr:hypothetical protein [Deltaproteobacteria bacterium]
MAGLSIPQPSADATDRDLLGTARGVGKPKTLPPPNRSKSASMAPIPPPPPLAPPPTPLPRPPTTKSPTLASMTVPPPPNTTLASPPRLESEDGEFDAMKTYQKEPAPKPVVKAAPARPSVPMPAKPKPKPAPRAPTPRPPTRLLAEDAAVDTDVSQQAIDEHSPATETFDTATNESTSFAQKPEKPVTSTMQTQSAPEDTGDDELMTAAREKVSRTDLELPTVRPPTETSPSTPPAPDTEPPAPTAELPDQEKPPVESEQPMEPAAPTERASTKVPISTAPDSLPPPTEKQAAASGPSPACPQCEAPMAWVEAHLRFYCKSCKMYF